MNKGRKQQIADPKILAAKKPERREPTLAETRAVDQAKRRNENRLARAQIEITVDDSNVGLTPCHSAGGEFQLHDAMGTTSPDFAEYALEALIKVSRVRGDVPVRAREANAALALLDGLKPENELEAMLASQIFACFNLGMDMAARSNDSNRPDLAETYAGISTKMMRTMTATVETLSKLRRGGSQTVRVEHVHVHNGGQAIVGNVSTGGGGNGRIDTQSQAFGSSEQNSAVALALSGADAFGQSLPISINAERSVSDARRDKSGSASG